MMDISFGMNETSFLELFDKLTRAFVSNTNSGHVFTTVAPFRLWAEESIFERRENEVCKKLKFLAFDKLLDLKQKRESKLGTGSANGRKFEDKSIERIVFECVFTCPVREERKLFLELLSNLLEQLESKADSSRTILWLHFLASLQNGADYVANADSLTPVQVSQALTRDRVSKTSTLKRFFEVDDVPDCGQNRMFDAVSKRRFTQFFTPPSSNPETIGATTSRFPSVNGRNEDSVYQFGRMLPDWQNTATAHTSGVDVDEGFSEESPSDETLNFNSENAIIAYEPAPSQGKEQHESVDVWDRLRVQIQDSTWDGANRPRRSWDHFGRLFPSSEGYPQHCFATDYINGSNNLMNASRYSNVGVATSGSNIGGAEMSCIDMIKVNSEPDSVFVDEQLIISHCLSVLIGVSSSTFLFQISDSDFVVQGNLRIKNLTPQSLRCLLEDFADAGTCFERLSIFSENVRGLFVGQLALEISKYLKNVHALVVKIYESIFLDEDCHKKGGGMRLKKLCDTENEVQEEGKAQKRKMSLLKLHMMTKQMRDVLIFLLEFVSAAPRGHALLSYIYRKALDFVGTPWYDAVLKILAACSQPYISLIEDWIYHGNLNEEFYSTSCEEFVINTEPQYLKWRSRKFWTKGFKLNVNKDKSNVPLFLRDHVEQMFACGKTILLLKLCQPQHYLVSNFFRAPSLMMTFDWQEVQEIEDECTRYTKQLQKLIQAEKDAAEEKENEEERRKREMVAHIRRAATLEFTELAKRVALENENLRVKRAAELLELKQEMESDLQRRRDQVAEEKRKDRELTELGLAKDAAELERMKAFEEQARQELIAYYEELGAEAMLKEQRALWRIRRHQLNDKRYELLTKSVEETYPVTTFYLETTNAPRLTDNAEKSETKDISAEAGDVNVDLILNASDETSADNQIVSDTLSTSVIDGRTANDSEKLLSRKEDNSTDADTDETNILDKKAPSKPSEVTEVNESIPELATSENLESHVCSEAAETTLESLSVETDRVLLDKNSSNTVSDDARDVSEASRPETASAITGSDSKKDGSFTRPMIRVGISMNQDTQGILSWREVNFKKIKHETDANKNDVTEETDDDHPYSRNFLDDEDAKIAPYVKSYPELLAYPSGELCTKIYSTNNYYSNGDGTLPLLMSTEVHSSSDAITFSMTSSGVKSNSDDIISTLKTREEVEKAKASEISKMKYGSSMKSLPLAVLMKRLIVQPLEKQTNLANSCARDLLFIDHQLWLHFQALRRTLLLADPEFAHGFCTSAFGVFDSASHVVSSGPTGSPVGNDSRALSIAFFSRALNFAVERSRWNKKDVLFERLQVKLRIRTGTEDFMDLYHADCFSCIALLYRVNWPLNVIISDSCLEKYIKLFHLLLALRRLSFILSKLFFQLKKTERLFDTTCSPQFSKVQFGRHIMQHNSNVLSDYLHEQLLSLSWSEFKQAMDKARSVDDMHNAHASYLNTMICRALLNEKASKVLKIIKSMMTQSITFERQVSLGSWAVSESTGQLEHSNFHALMQSVKSFRNHSKFLNKIVTKLSNAGYQPHLQNFLLKLDFNGYFSN